MKYLIILLSLSTLMISACKKKSPANAGPDPVSSPYYFKFTFGGTSYNFVASSPQYMPFYTNEAGGYEDSSNLSVYTSVGLRLSWPNNDTVKESDLMGLIGRTLYFTDTFPHPELTYDKNYSSQTYYSADTASSSYYVKITNVTYLKRDTTLGYNVKTYILEGTCNALMSQINPPYTPFSAGQFRFVISREDY